MRVADDHLEGTKRLAPPFRWPGGKRWVVDSLIRLIGPETSGSYFEPFFGGGALFFALRPASATISDRNADLMECYVAIRDKPRQVEAALRNFEPGADAYYAARNAVPADAPARAARLIYLATHSFNGIYRVNLAGAFNVPYGHRSYALGTDMSLEPHSQALREARILTSDFRAPLSGASAGDIVYLDPPYTVTHSRNGFIKYNARVFNWRDQRRLARTAEALAQRGCRVIVSNADHETIEELYPAFRVIRVARPSRIAADTERRRQISELILTNIEARAEEP